MIFKVLLRPSFGRHLGSQDDMPKADVCSKYCTYILKNIYFSQYSQSFPKIACVEVVFDAES